jgi:small-conductance mechanosensitive channel
MTSTMDENPYAPPQREEKTFTVPGHSLEVPKIVWVIQYLLIICVAVLFVGAVLRFVINQSLTSLVFGGLLGWFLQRWFRGHWTTERVVSESGKRREVLRG